MFFGGGGGGGGQWYRNLFGFTESTLEGTRREFTIEEAPGDTLLLRSKKNNKAYNVGNFSTPSLGELQARAGSLARGRGLIRVTTAVNDVSVYHGLPENKHAKALLATSQQKAGKKKAAGVTVTELCADFQKVHGPFPDGMPFDKKVDHVISKMTSLGLNIPTHEWNAMTPSIRTGVPTPPRSPPAPPLSSPPLHAAPPPWP